MSTRMNILYKSVVLVMFFNIINGYQLSKEYPICKQSDPNFEECVCKSVTKVLNILGENGDKELGVRKLEPMLAREVYIPGNGGKVDLEQRYKDLNFYGFGNTNVKEFKLDIKGSNCMIHMETYMPTVRLIGQYEITGKLLVFTLNGFGRENITLVNLDASHVMKCEKTNKGGKEFINILKYELDLRPETLFYDFENLVNGNAELSAQVLKVLNDNPMDIYAEIKQDYEIVVAEIFRQTANTIFNKIPVNEIFFD